MATRSTRRAAATLAVAVLSLTTVMGAAQDPDLETVASTPYVTVSANTDRTVVEYDYTAPLAGKPVVTVHTGTRVGGVCEFSGTISAPAGETRVWESRELSTNLDTCTMVTEGSWVTGDDNTVLYSYSGSMKGWTEDPPGLDVASTKSSVMWNASSTCVTAHSMWSTWGWFFTSGWVKTTSWTGSDTTGCERGRTSFGAFKNGIFCGTIDAFAEHTVTFTAKKAGSSSASWTLKKWGGCSWLLSSHHSYDPN